MKGHTQEQVFGFRVCAGGHEMEGLHSQEQVFELNTCPDEQDGFPCAHSQAHVLGLNTRGHLHGILLGHLHVQDLMWSE